LLSFSAFAAVAKNSIATCEEGSFFVCHAYFLGANDPYKSLKTTLNSDTSRPLDKPKSKRLAVKVVKVK